MKHALSFLSRVGVGCTLVVLAGCVQPPSEEADEGLAIAAPQPLTLPIATPVRWVVLRCNFQDDTTQPLTLDYYRDLFTAAGNGKGNLVDYLDTVSYGSIDFGFSDVPARWFTIPEPAAKNQGSNVDRGTRAEKCMAAADATVDFKHYKGVIAFFNREVDWGAAGPTTKEWDGVAAGGLPMVVLTPGSSNLSLAAQEVIHGLGLGPHSRDVKLSNCGGAPGDYCDPWDVMSAMNVNAYDGAFGFVGEAACKGAAGKYCRSGPSLNVHFREDFGWLDTRRIHTWGTTFGTGGWLSENIPLAAVDAPSAPGYLEVKVPLDSGIYLTLELRVKRGWDRGEPFDSVLLHEIHADQVTYLLDDVPNGLRAGEAYTDTANNVRISVLSIDSAAQTALVNVRLNRMSPFAPKCGAKPCPKLPL